ncbi:MAG: hypothetical protein FWC71_03505 [Defluviitaleaceae bacterium]|nr:hypothetical protein [Defluviitaleaceae bacterium]
MKNIPYSQKIFGSVAYWLSIACVILALIVTILILIAPTQNVLHPSTTFEMIFDGATPEEIWAHSESGLPGGHFYLNFMNRMDSWAMLIIVIGSAFGLFALVPAVLYQLFKERDWFCAGLGIVIMLLISLSALGVLN